MAERLTNLTCERFAADLAAKKPVPGGGGAAALAGALGAALCEMVGVYTVGKPAYADVEEEVACLNEDARFARERLLELVDLDAEAFEPLSRAYGISKGDPDRESVLEEATKAAARVPYQAVRELCAVIVLLEGMERKGSRMLLSDVGCAALLCGAALKMAVVNVLVNTASLHDRAYACTIEDDCDALLAEYGARANDVAERVMGAMRERGCYG